MQQFKVVPIDEARAAVWRRERSRQLRGENTNKRRWRWLIALVAAIVALAAAGLIWFGPSARVVPSIGDRDFLVVVTGSMSPAVKTGDMVAVRPVRPQSVRAGDIITFRDAAQPHILVTHRVVSIYPGDTGPVFITKGDANPVADILPVAASQLVGRVDYRVPYAGYAVTFLRSPFGVLSLIIAPGTVLIYYGVRLIKGLMRESETA